jgi:tRNA-splicing ligase RtcB
MAMSELQGKQVNVKLWAPVHEVESQALDQLRNIASLPWVFHHVAAMPDVHFGKGATVGSVIAMKGAVAPAAVGVDIGCGMGAVRTNLKADDLPDGLGDLRADIEAAIPVGFNSHEDPRIDRDGQDFARLVVDRGELFDRYRGLSIASNPKLDDREGVAKKQVGTLGGGNHFIEICLDQEQRVWLMLHSGSRNIGKTLAENHLWVAKQMEHNKYIPDRDLSVFLAGTPEMDAYRRDLYWAQEYAFLNRRVMFNLLTAVFSRAFPRVKYEAPILCHHNYVAEEQHFGEHVYVTRKGAINAEAGQLGIIPGSMGTKSYIVEGLGNPEAYSSASHGAGRRMSRGAAKRHFTVDDLAAQTVGVECRKDESVLDEIPGAYKDIDRVMANQADLVKIVATLKQVLCVKG